MKTIFSVMLVSIGLTAGIILQFGGCSSNEPIHAAESSATKDLLTISGPMASNLSFARAEIEPIRTETALSGRIDFDPNDITHVFPLVTGIISRIYLNQGDNVHTGQILADVYSADIATAVSDLAKARANEEVADKSLERMKYLLKEKLVAPSDLEQAESAATLARAEYDRSIHALKILGGSESTTGSTFHIVAPLNGTVLERPAQPGSQVRNDGSTPVCTIGSTKSLWVTLDAYPNDLNKLHVGDSVVLRAAGLESESFVSRIEYISPTVDPSSFTTKIRCTLPNSGGSLKPAMFVNARVYHPDGKGLFVPSASVFYDANGKAYVFEQTTSHSFRKTEVTVAASGADRAQILSGLHVGDTIAADKALFLNDELQADQK